MNAGLNHVLTIDRIARHVLVLSQDRGFARDVEAALRKDDYETTIVRAPRQAALTVLNQRDIDAMICDGQIASGREEQKVVQQIRQNPESFSIPLVMRLDPEDEGQWHLADKLATDEFVLTSTPPEELVLRLKGLWWRTEMRPARPDGQPWPNLLQDFLRHVKSDLETKFDAAGSASLALIEVMGARDLDDEAGDQLTDQLLDFLATNLRRIDRVVRYGRVTLIVYLPGRGADLAREAMALLQAEFLAQTRLNLCVGLASYPHDGARFTELLLSADHALTRARRQGTGTGTPELSQRNGAPAGAYKILIADDDPFLMTLLRASFQALGYHPMEATNGQDAIELVHREQPDLVLLDHHLPELAGLEWLEQLRACYDDRLPMPVIMLTIMTSQQDIMRGFELGVEDYVRKPFHPRELMARVERALASQPSFLRTRLSLST
jgi:DNA-binding response OmpR family regulator